MKLGAMVAVSSFALSQVAAGQAVQWKVSEGGNGHWYRWTGWGEQNSVSAYDAQARLKGGHLVTLTSASEESFVRSLAVSGSCGDQTASEGLIGAVQEADAVEPAGGWRWVTGEPMVYMNWRAGEPNDAGGIEDTAYLNLTGNWNDGTQNGLSCSNAAIFEWSADCNNDGIVDYGQCRDGSLVDANLDNIPDTCQGVEAGFVVVADSVAQFQHQQGAGGWFYEFDNGAGTQVRMMPHFILPDEVWCAEPSFGADGSYCSLGGTWSHSATVALCSSPGELQRPRRRWESTAPLRGKICVSGSFLCHSGERTRIEVYVDGVLRYSQDATSNASPSLWERFGVEIDAGIFSRLEVVQDPLDGACHSDAFLAGVRVLAEDCDTDGIPEICSFAVPSEYSTIQDAIDAVPSGQFGLVRVAAGTYHESFSLNGKNVRVQGAPNNATILDGTGLTASIARFSGGEPATAGLANLVFRNGTAGSRITPKSTFTVGGALYGLNSAALITNCRFEQNEADFGGAVYLLRCDSAVEACVFAGNEALTDGGAFFAYECAGFVRSSDFTANSCGAIGSGNGGAFKTVGGKTAGGTFLLQDCSITGTISGVDGAAIHHFENSDIGTRGLLRIVDTEISANATVVGAAGVRNDGPQTALVLAGTTAVCGNTPRNVAGPFLIERGASVCGCLADVTGDGQVNGGDLGIVLNSWGGADALGSGDVNHDGVIDASDLSVVLSSWGACGN